MKLFRPLLALALGLATCSSANAVLIGIDFVGLANGSPGEGGIEGQTFTFGGVPVTITSSHNAYLDSGSNNTTNAAGLGVCSTGLTTGQNKPNNRCLVNSDDNVTVQEWVMLDFGDYFVESSDWSFNKAAHGPTSSTETFLLALDGLGGSNVFALGTQTAFGNPLSVGGSFNRITFGFDVGASGNQFYVAGATNVNAVPLPGSVALLGAGLFAMGMVSRTRSRKKRIF